MTPPVSDVPLDILHKPSAASPDGNSIGMVEVIVEEADAGSRIDLFLVVKLPDVSRSQIQALIRAGHVTADDHSIVEPKHRVKSGSQIVVTMPEPTPALPVAQAIALTVVYEDDALIVIDKPAGLVVHPAAGHADGTLVNALLAHCGDSLSGIGGERRPGIVHRLDKDTSGLIVVAKSDKAHRGLSEQFAAHGVDGRLQRAYLAIVWGVPERPHGQIVAALGRKAHDRIKMAVVHNDTGRHAVTHYAVEQIFHDAEGIPVASLVRCMLETGRTHQIRVHMTHLGHPLLGDQTYGRGFATSSSRLSAAANAALLSLNRQALHATVLGFDHPITGKALLFESPPPADLAGLIAALHPKAGRAGTTAPKPATAKRRRSPP
jgi:23S rRNA pseudouridine1911/1915/1917 synthase